jgi:hypothetical protein
MPSTRKTPPTARRIRLIALAVVAGPACRLSSPRFIGSFFVRILTGGVEKEIHQRRGPCVSDSLNKSQFPVFK